MAGIAHRIVHHVRRQASRGRLAAGLAFAAAACAQAPSGAPTVVPVYQEPRHHLAFQSPLVRVLDVRLSPGDTSHYHVHADRMVGIAVQDARIWAQAPGARPGPVATPRATPYSFQNWSQDLPYTHRVANADTVPLHYVVAEWLGRSGTAGRPLPDGPTRQLVQEGPTARVYEIVLAPGAATEPHAHGTPGLVVLGNDGVLVDDGSARARGGAGAGSWTWRESADHHTLRNEGSTRLVVFEIDWR